VNVRVGPPFEETHETLTLVRACPPDAAPVTLTPRSCDWAEVSNAETAAGCAGTPNETNADEAALEEDAPAALEFKAVQV
jgi:hypothetical protein